MGWARATLLRHRGHGPCHADLVLETGATCATIRLGVAAGRWLVTIGVPHRRRYLTYRGPVAGRGAVAHLWRGHVWQARSAHALQCRMHPNQMYMMKMRRMFSVPASTWESLPGKRGQLVVPLPRSATLPRS